MFVEEEITALWESGGAWQRVAAGEVCADFERLSPLFFRLLHSDADGVLSAAARSLLPFLRRGYAPPQPFEDGAAFERFASLHERMRTFFRALERQIDLCPEHGGRALLRLLRERFPGIGSDLERRYPALCRGAGEASGTAGEVAPRQLMIFVTGRCNLHCPYCFSAGIERREIAWSDLERIFTWARREGVTTMTPCGGEPLLYRHFDGFLRLCRRFGMRTYFASNMIPDCSGFEGFASDPIRVIYVHLADESLRRASLRRALLAHVELAKERGIELIARANIAGSDARPLRSWFDFIDLTGIRRLHVALTIPSAGAENRFVDPGAFRDYVPLLRRLVDEAEKRGIALGFAKPLPVCIFPEPLALKLLREGYDTSMCNIFEDDCMYNISLSPAMRFTPCLGVSQPEVPFDETLRWEELGGVFRPVVARLLEKPLRDQCRSCLLWQRKLCQGACLSYKC